MLTGEPVPVEVGPGDRSSAGASTRAAGWWSAPPGSARTPSSPRWPGWSTEAQSGKAPVQRLADRSSGVFVPRSSRSRLVTWAGGWGRAAGRGGVHRRGRGADRRLPVRARPGHADRAAGRHRPRRAARHPDHGPGGPRDHPRVDTVVLDKTGTVTTGEMTLADVVPGAGRDAGRLLRLAAALEAASEHPGRRSRPSPPARPPGRTVAGTCPRVAASGRAGLGARHVDGHAVAPAAALLDRAGLKVPSGAGRGAGAGRGQQGRTAVLPPGTAPVRGVLASRDTIRPTSAQAVARLRRLGLRAGAADRRQPGAPRARWPRRSASTT